MGRFKEELKSMGYNAKERAYIYGGAIIGAVAPIVGARYLLTAGGVIKPHSWVGEVIAWGGAVLMNASPMIFSPHLPIPAYTGIGGAIIGTLVADKSAIKRCKKERGLEDITKEVSE